MHWFGETRENYCPDWFDAMALAFPERWCAMEGQAPSAVLLKRTLTPDRVAVIISGGGSNGPFIPGFVGEGLADAAVVGPPYTAPSAYAIYEAGKAIGREKGVLLLYNNFMGDYLNNDMAAELLQLDGYAVEQAICYDDMGMAIGEPKENRGGRIGIAYAIRICAESARRGDPLHEVARLARKAMSRVSTLCVTVEPEKDRVTYGTGFSDEPGFLTREGASIGSTAEETIRFLYGDVDPQPGERIYLLVNRMRMTSYSDSYVMAGKLHAALSRRAPVARMSVGGYMQVMDRYGYTVTLLCADDELAACLDGTLCGDGFLL
ncbi:MAG: dihydroxyacetone kinase subunit DhaK [Clostridia bacterium]|nr:dihydroxyacetone kinase subunit DhaK [Clostridia bacterium]